MSCTCKGYKPTSEIITYDSNVKLKVFNDEKTLITSENGTCLCRVSAFHYDIKMLFTVS